MSGIGPAPFSVSVDERNGQVLLVVRGELDLATAPQLEQELLPRLQAGAHALLDLRGLEFMDSTGVRVIVAAHHAAQDHDGRLSLLRCEPDGAVGRVLEISGLDGILDVVDDA